MTNILYPAIMLALFTFLMAFWMARERFAAIKNREVKLGDPGVRPTFSGRAGQVSNAYHNLLELPVLFYAVVAFAMAANGDDATMNILAWIFVACRIVQGLIHGTYNKVLHRFLAFLSGLSVLVVMWLKLLLHVSSATLT
ncbi:MAG: MAPEG family protein [Hyphomicrobium sp.]